MFAASLQVFGLSEHGTQQRYEKDHDCSSTAFVRPTVQQSVRELLKGSELEQYAAAFEGAQLDAALAAELELRDIRELLSTAPLAHCLLIRRRLSERALTVAMVPDSPAWLWASRVISNGVRDGNLKESSTIMHEVDLISGSLFLAFSIAPLLSPPDSCAQGALCKELMAIDMILWTVLTGSLFVCVVNAWVCVKIEQTVSVHSLPQWLQDHFPYWNSAGALLVIGLTVLPPALCTRSVILLRGHEAYPPWLTWAVVAILSSGWCAVWISWVSVTRSTFGLNLYDFPAFNMGLLGARMPKSELKRAPQQAPPYVT